MHIKASLATVQKTILNPLSGLFLGWDLDSFRTARKLAHESKISYKANIIGYSTCAVRDVGGASIRIRFDDTRALQSGGYLFMLKNQSNFHSGLPAIACIPGNTPDRRGNSREGLAECIVMGKPATAGSDPRIVCTFFPEDVSLESFNGSCPVPS